jgi:hypothetical protein
MSYVLDTSSWRVVENYYPSRFPSFWSTFDAFVAGGNIISVREALRELGHQLRHPQVQAWIQRNRWIFLQPTPEETVFVGAIFAIPHFQGLIGLTQRLKGTPVADPFIIAAAHVRGICVVTEESLKPNAAKIPNVCEHFGVDWCNFEGLMTREGWSF